MSWLTGWTYRKSVPLSRASGAVSNYQMKLLLGESSGATGESVDCGGKCLSTFNDIRFTTSDGETLLDYYIESITGTTPNQLATIWIEFDSISTGDTTFYMYYGKADAAIVSSGANTFILFDDFERGANGDAVGGAWTVAQGSCIISTDHAVGGSRCCKMVGGATTPKMQINQAAASNEYEIRYSLWKENATLSLQMYHGNGTNMLSIIVDVSENLLYYTTTSIDTTKNITADAWNLLQYNNIDFAASYDIILNSVVAKDNAAIRVFSSFNGKIYFLTDETTAGRDVYLDNVIVRNWRAVEPTWGAWGEEEEEVVVVEITITADPIEASLSIPASTCLNIGSVVDGLITCSLSIPASTYLTVGLVAEGLITYSVSITAKIVVPVPAVRLPSTWITESKNQLPWAVDQDSINWLADKGEGVWDFEEARRVFGYNNNPRFTKVATSKHQPCGHWHKVPSHYEWYTYAAGEAFPVEKYYDMIMSSDGTYLSISRDDRAIATKIGGIYTSQSTCLSCDHIIVEAVRYNGMYMSNDGKYQFTEGVSAAGLTTKRSIDYGVTWTTFDERAGGTVKLILLSTDGQYQFVVYDSPLDPRARLSNDYGESWTDINTVGQNVRCPSMSPSGQYLAFKTNTSNIWYRSADYGNTWATFIQVVGGAGSVLKITDEGVYYIREIGGYNSAVYKSTTYGASWTLLFGGNGAYYPIAPFDTSLDCKYIALIVDSGTATGTMFISRDYGATYYTVTYYKSNVLTTNIRISNDGKYMLYGTQRKIFRSRDYGYTWNLVYYDETAELAVYSGKINCAMSSNGRYMACMMPQVSGGDKILFSSDYGASWSDVMSITTTHDNQLVIDEIVDEIVNEPVVWRTP
jgi:photosystem II stability/assembly factor-like uncharacterized protein